MCIDEVSRIIQNEKTNRQTYREAKDTVFGLLWKKKKKENQLVMFLISFFFSFFLGHVASLTISWYCISPIMVRHHRRRSLQRSQTQTAKIRYLLPSREKVWARQRSSRVSRIYEYLCSLQQQNSLNKKTTKKKRKVQHCLSRVYVSFLKIGTHTHTHT